MNITAINNVDAFVIGYGLAAFFSLIFIAWLTFKHGSEIKDLVQRHREERRRAECAHEDELEAVYERAFAAGLEAAKPRGKNGKFVKRAVNVPLIVDPTISHDCHAEKG